MKRLKIIGIGILILLVCCAGGGYVYLSQTAPQYEGTLQIAGLHDSVEVVFDTYGVPHIYGSNEEDVYFALGYVHAQDRLFQMEIVRRVAQGKLSEILGPDLIDADILFRTLSLHENSIESAKAFLSSREKPFQKAALAYLDGVNQYIEHGDTPIEFNILGIEKEPFTPENIFDITGYMAFGFAEGLREEPIVNKIHSLYGMDYLMDLDLNLEHQQTRIPWLPRDTAASSPSLAARVNKVMEKFPLGPLIGSNAWVISEERSASGKVLFANDPHIGYSQPAVWYEAHLEAPGFSFYGNFLAGFPFAPIGHTRRHAIGLTMLENDDIQFYRERQNPQNPDQIWRADHWEDLKIREEIIHVKGENDTTIRVRSSLHGPVINDAYPLIEAEETEPVALAWVFHKQPSGVLEASYGLAHGNSMEEIRKEVAKIHAPGLNVMYGDIEGNIAWYTTGLLAKYPDHVNTKLILDGASGEDEPLKYFTFDEHPQVENPPSGYVYSANNQPDPIDGYLLPGYYTPHFRATRIMSLIDAKPVWSAEEVREMVKDDTGPYPRVLAEILPLVKMDQQTSPQAARAMELMNSWTGSHQLEDIGPTLYYKFINRILYYLLADELGDEDYLAFATTHLMKRSIPFLMANPDSPWWDNKTTEEKETREQIVNKAFGEALAQLSEMLGDDISQWRWSRIHTLEHEHLIGRVEPMDKVFNVGPFPIAGGQEVINNTGFRNRPDGQFEVYMGPSRRAVIDFGDLSHAQTILPTGQSGNPMSPHYSDQAEMYARGEYRTMWLEEGDVRANQKHQLWLVPKQE